MELLIVVALGAALATMGFITLSGVKQGYDVDAATRDLVAVLRETRVRSITQENSLPWGVNVVSNPGGTDYYEVYSGASYATSSVKNTYYVQSGVQFAEPSGGRAALFPFTPAAGTLNSRKVLTLVSKSTAGLIGDIVVDTKGGISSLDDHGITGYWHLDEGTGTSTADASGYGGTGTLYGATWAATSTCTAGRCLSFNGSSAYVGVPSAQKMPSGNDAYTILAWIKPNAYGTEGIVGWGTWGTQNAVNALRLNSTGLVNYWWGNDLTVVASGLTNGNWHMVVAEFDGTTRSLYVDGTLAGSDTPTGHNATLADFRIGDTNSTEYFNGSIDEVLVYNRALTADEIAARYNELR